MEPFELGRNSAGNGWKFYKEAWSIQSVERLLGILQLGIISSN